MKPRGLAYFYCKYTQVESNGVSQVLCSLIAQLIRCLPHPEASLAMRPSVDCDDGTLTPNVNRTENLLVSLINDMESVYICLDALDECDPDDKNELLRFICDDIRKFGNVKIILSSLIEAGADLTLGDENSWTSLHLAAHYGHREAVMVLLEDPASFSIFTRVGLTPLHAAIEQEHIEIVRLFGRFAHAVSTLLANHGVRQRRISPSNPRQTNFKARGTATDADESSLFTGSIPLLSEPRSSSANLSQELVPTPLFLATLQSYLAGVDVLMAAGADPENVRVCIQHAFTTGKGNTLVRLVNGAEQPIKSLLRLPETGGSSSPDSVQASFHILTLENRRDSSGMYTSGTKQRAEKLAEITDCSILQAGG